MLLAIGCKIITVIRNGKKIKKYQNVYEYVGQGGSDDKHRTRLEVDIRSAVGMKKIP